MKILYGIQGTGNGHICRAKEIIPSFEKYGEVDVLLSGLHSEIKLPFELKYQFKGLGFVFGKKGGIDYLNTYLKNHINRFIKEVRSFDVSKYDLIVSDFEPITSWAAHLNKKPCVALSNQCTLLSDSIPKPKNEDLLGKMVLNYYAPSTAEYGFSYKALEPHIFTPIIRKEIRDLFPVEGEHYTVYLPSYNDQRIQNVLSQIKDIKWEVFSKNIKKDKTIGNIMFKPVQSETFMESFANCKGILTAAGFGTTSEALYLNKKLLVIPQKHQFEQSCNAKMLKDLGVTVVKKLKAKHLPKIEEWVRSDEKVRIDYPDQTELIVETIIYNEYYNKDNYLDYITSDQYQF